LGFGRIYHKNTIMQRKRAPPVGEEKRLILEVIRKNGTMTLDEIWEATGFNPNTMRGVVVRLTNAGLIERVGKGVYRKK